MQDHILHNTAFPSPITMEFSHPKLEMMFEKLHNFSQSNSNIFQRLVLIKLLLTTDNLVKVDVGYGKY